VLAPAPQRVITRTGLLVFSSSAPFGPTFAAAANDVYTARLDGASIKPVTRFGDARLYAIYATISADGSSIAFESNYAASGPSRTDQIWVVRPDGSGMRQISSGADAATNPSISADGSVVVYEQSGQIKAVRTSGDGAVLALTRLSTSAAHNPV